MTPHSTRLPAHGARLSTTTRVMLLTLALCLSAGIARAEHEADHRYIVEGYVLDAQEQPRADVQVVVTGDEGLLGEAVTDHRGFYRVRLHLHNQDLGKMLTVQAGDLRKEIEVTFDPSDRETDRIHDLSFVGAATTQADLGMRGLPTWAYVLAAVVLLLVAARIVAQLVKKRRKRQAKQQQKQAKKKRKKPKRKPRRK